MLTKLVEASGHRLLVDALPLPNLRRGLPDTPMGRRLRRRRRAVLEVCSRRGATNVRVFGSVARGDDTTSSDVDLLVDLDEGVGLVALAGLQRELRDLLGVEVDVVPAVGLKRGLQQPVMDEAIPL
jgi:predicted nucleotidyltransferase